MADEQQQQRKRVRVSLEPHRGARIRSMAPTGHETFVPDLTVAQRTFQRVQRLDFGLLEEQPGGGVEKNAEQEGKDEQDVAQEQPTPEATAEETWMELQLNLRFASQQIEMLSDTLSVVKGTNYLNIERLRQSEQKPVPLQISLDSKRIHAASTGRTLKAAAKRLAVSVRQFRSFYHTLSELSRMWHFQMCGPAIVSNFSFSSHGSVYTDKGTAEVVKPSEDNASDDSLVIVVPAKYRGVSACRVGLCNDKFERISTDMTLEDRFTITELSPKKCKQVLEVAQQNIFNRELFMCLMRDAHSSSRTIANVVSFDRFVLPVTANVHLAVSFSQGPLIPINNEAGNASTPRSDTGKQKSEMDTVSQREGMAADTENIVELMLQLMLRKQQKQAGKPPNIPRDPRDMRGPILINAREMTRHSFYRHNLSRLLDKLAFDTNHRNSLFRISIRSGCSLESGSETTFRVLCRSISLPGRTDFVSPWEFQLVVRAASIVCVSPDVTQSPKVVTVSELKPFLLQLFALFQVRTIADLASRYGYGIIEETFGAICSPLLAKCYCEDTKNQQLLTVFAVGEQDVVRVKVRTETKDGKDVNEYAWDDITGRNAQSRVHRMLTRA